MSQPILVAGATGGVGQHLVGRLMAQDQNVRALVRDMSRAEQLFSAQDRLTLVEGDTTKPITLPSAVVGASAVICAIAAKAPVGETSPEKIDYEGVRNLVLAARNAGVRRFILVSALGVTHPEHPMNNFGRMLDWKRKGEDVLRTSGLLYTVVRPGGLNDAPGGASGIRIDQGDRISGAISRSDVAAICAAALDAIASYHTTFEIVAAEGKAPENLPDLFAALKTDRELDTKG